MPNGIFHAMSPVLTFTAASSPQGGCWHGYLLLSQKRVYESSLRYLSIPVPATMWPTVARLLVLTNRYPSCGLYAPPPQLPPPIVPLNTTVTASDPYGVY